MKVRHFHVRPDIPEALKPLEDLARNLWFSWNWEAVQLFIRLNPALWERSYQNPVLMLGLLPQEDLDAAAADESFVANLNRVHRTFNDYLAAPTWFQERHGDEKGFLAAYFSCEFGIDEGLPIYSGGLGILSGDHLKSASDLGLPLVGVGLLYQKGYFRQVLSLDGWQQEQYPENDWYNMPVTLMKGEDGNQVTIEIDMAGENVTARVWRVQVGRTPLYLLDTNLVGNSARARDITSTLYGGDREQRLRQEMLLGMGGVKVLKALGLAPSVYHMNEGHSAFLILERTRMLMADRGLSLEAARELVFATNVFTTHTPVPAGNEVFDPELLRKYLQPTADALGIGWDAFLALGQGCQEPGQAPLFGMTVFALRNAAFANGVSALHGEVSRKMWKSLWPTLPEAEVPIGHVTNGVHTLTWLSHEMEELYLRYLGPRFIEKPADHKVWERIAAIPDGEMWRAHQTRKERLVFFIRKRLKSQLLRQVAGAGALRAAEEVLNPEALTIGFSRRFATYKRAGLLFRQPERLAKLLADADRPVQIVFAGKAHPQDLPAKEIIRSVVHFTQDARVRHQLVFLEDYDLNVARYLVQGVDVWLNTPRRPLEASGTSGMKAAVNGALNVSVLDGWWCEGNDLDTGWSIGGTEEYKDTEEQDQVECEALFNLLEREIVPLFYKRDRADLPREWIGMMKGAVRKLGAVFNTNRMVEEYTERFYLSAHAAGARLSQDGLEGAKRLADWRKRVSGSWSDVSVRTAERRKDKTIFVGNSMELTVRVALGDLTPEDVAVEIWYGPMDSNNEIRDGRVALAVHEGKEGADDVFRADLPAVLTGRYGYTARAVPQHPDLVNPLTPLLISWE